MLGQDETGELTGPRKATQQDGRDHGRHQRYGTVEHPGKRRVDPLLGDREKQQRQSHPDDTQKSDAAEIRAVDRPPRLGEQRQSDRPKPDARQRDHSGA